MRETANDAQSSLKANFVRRADELRDRKPKTTANVPGARKSEVKFTAWRQEICLIKCQLTIEHVSWTFIGVHQVLYHILVHIHSLLGRRCLQLHRTHCPPTREKLPFVVTCETRRGELDTEKVIGFEFVHNLINIAVPVELSTFWFHTHEWLSSCFFFLISWFPFTNKFLALFTRNSNKHS